MEKKPKFDLIIFLAELQSPWPIQILAIISMFIFYSGATYLLSDRSSVILPSLAGLAFMAQIYFHEFGHWLVFIKNGIDAIVLTISPLGAVAKPRTAAENKKSDQISWMWQSVLMLAGPLFNLILSLVALPFTNSDNELVKYLAGNIVYLGVFLAFFNLLPLGKLDAGQFIGIVFASLPKKFEWLVLAIPTVLLIAAATIIGVRAMEYEGWNIFWSIIIRLGWIIVIGAIFLGVLTKMDDDDAKELEYLQSPQRMSYPEVIALLTFYYGLLLGLLALVVNTPFFVI